MAKTNNSSLDKKNRIIAVALDEFAANGYTLASTNVIAEKAQVSKGLIFHIFSSKKSLYLELIDVAIRNLSKYLRFYAVDNDDDFFHMLKIYGQLKLNYYIEHSNEYKILCEAFFNTPKEAKVDLEHMYNEIYKNSYEIIINKFNKEKLRQGVDRQKALEIILNGLHYIEKKYLDAILNKPNYGINNIKELNEDYMKYLDIIINGLR